MIEYGFIENIDFSSIVTESTGGRPSTDHAIKLDMAKEICMTPMNDTGHKKIKGDNIMKNLIKTEYRNKLILTTEQVADAYQVKEKIIRNNFNRNKNKYIEGKHYFCLKGDDLKEFLSKPLFEVYSKNTPSLYLWTEKGCFLHAKSLNNDIAWSVYDTLVDSYFTNVLTADMAIANPDFAIKLLTELKNEQEKSEQLLHTIKEQKPKVDFAEAVSFSKSTVLVGELAKYLQQNDIIDTGQNRLFEWLRQNKYLIGGNRSDKNIPTQRSIERGLFVTNKELTINKKTGETIAVETPRVTVKGQKYFINLFLKQKYEQIKISLFDGFKEE